MVKTRYTLCRDFLYCGVVTIKRNHSIFQKSMIHGDLDDGFFPSIERPIVELKREVICRTISYTVSNESNLAIDALYKTDQYMIEGKTPAKEYPDENPIINSNFFLGKLLDFLGYSIEISDETLQHFMRNLTKDDKLISELCKLYGFKMNENGIFIPVDEGYFPQEEFRALRDIHYAGTITPCIYEPGAPFIERRKK